MKRKLGWFGLGFAGAELAAAILPPLVCVPAAAFLVCLALLWIKRRRDSAIPVLGALCGLAWFLVFTLVWVRPVKALAGQTVTCTAVVETDADASYSESRLRGTLRLTEIDGRAANVKVQCASFPGESAGERFTAKFALTELPDNKYRLSRHSKGVYLQAEYLGSYHPLDASLAPRFALYRLRQRWSATLHRWLPRQLDGIEAAMLLADKSRLDDSVQQAFRTAGVSHLLAVSGLHTGIVFVLINAVLWWLPLLRRGHLLKNLLAAGAVWLFVAAAGFPPSAVRAAVMCTVLQAALASASEYVGMNALATAAFGMLLWNPNWLGDISFQLSFLAVAGILAWGVPLCRRCRTRWKGLNVVIDAYLIGLAATLATAPLVSHTFGVVPLAGLAVNPPAIALAGVVVFGGALWMLAPVGVLAPAFGFVTGTAAGGIDALARLTASLPGGAANYTLGGWQTAALYFVFVLATAAVWSAEPKKSVPLRT